MGFKDFFKRERQEDAKDERSAAKKAKARADYKAWLEKMLDDENTANVVMALDEMLLDYERLEDEAFGYTSRLNNQKQAILKLLEDNRELLLVKGQTVKMRGFVLGYVVNSKVETSEEFSLKEFLEEFDEDTVQFNLSRTAIKGAMKSSTLREHLKASGVSLVFREKWDIRDDDSFLEY